MQAIDNAELISTKLQLWMPSLSVKKKKNTHTQLFGFGKRKKSLLSWKTRKPRVAKSGSYNMG